jgi:hypothetical protein
VDKTGTLLERNEVMEEMRNYFQELTKENTSNWRNRPDNI